MRKKKKWLSIGVMLAMCFSLTNIKAQESQVQDDTTGMGSSEVTATLTDVPLTQMKVAMPIKIDFVMAPLSADGDTTNGANKVFVGDYKMEVLPTSEVDVELIGIKLNPKNGWEATSTLQPTLHQLKFQMAQSMSPNQLLIDSSQDISLFDTGNITKVNKIQNFIVSKGTSKSLGIQIVSPTQTKIQSSDAKVNEQAFEVIYTVQKYGVNP